MPRSLLQIIQGLIKAADQVRLSRVKESSGLYEVNCLNQHVMEECVLDVVLVD
jgi:hypothetical protein